MVILPPMGIADGAVNPSVMVALLDANLPGTLSSGLVKAKSVPAVIWLPSAPVFASVAFKSTEEATLKVPVPEATAPPVVIVPAAKVNV